ncbi:hypothetical protein SAMN06309944_2301 [Micrococcales bacterium KH10]|nr:hypothetical protein SAMN06309944_2301 [Micrococcales bacterium KH10]
MATMWRFIHPHQLMRLVAASFVAAVIGTIVLLVLPYTEFHAQAVYESFVLTAQVALPAIWMLAWPVDVLTHRRAWSTQMWLMTGIGALAGAVWMLPILFAEGWSEGGFSILSLFMLVYSVPPAAVTALLTFLVVDRWVDNRKLIYVTGPLCLAIVL